MRTPLVSICIPAYKKVQSLNRLLTSITEQTFTDFEVIITDDTPDDSIERLVNSFPLIAIQYFKNNPAAGMPGNWNFAIEKAKGSWIKIMHDDDWFSQADALQQFADAAMSNTNNFIFSACNNVYAKSGKTGSEHLEGERKELLELDVLNLFYLNVIGHPSTVMHRKDAAILYDTQFKWVVDIDFYIRYLHAHPGYTYINETLVNIGIDDEQVSASAYKNPAVEIPEYFTMLAKYPPDLLLKNQYVFHLVWNLVKRFKLKNVRDIRKYYGGTLPDKIEEIMVSQKNIPRIILKQTPWSKRMMKRSFGKLSG